MKPQLKPSDLPGILNISLSQAYALCNDPEFPAYKLRNGNGPWRIDPDDLSEWRRKQQQKKVEESQARKAHYQKKYVEPIEKNKVYKLNWS